MGNSHPERRRSHRSSSSSDISTDSSEAKKRIDEKELVFIPLQSEIDRAIFENNRDTIRNLMSEVAAHIVDLNQLKNLKLSSTNRGRLIRVTLGFELLLAKLKSIHNYDTGMKKERDRKSSSASFYVEPDLVSDLIQFDNTNANSRTSDQCYAQPSSSECQGGEPIYVNKVDALEESFVVIESELEVIKDQAQRPVEDVNDYYQMDKGIFYLYVKLKNLDVPQNSVLHQRKFKLLEELAEFRMVLDKQSGELEEQKEVDQEINTLELLLDSASVNEMYELKTKALLLQERLEKSAWNSFLTQRKVELLRRLAGLLERIAYSCPSPTIDSYVQHVYGNLMSLKEEKSEAGDDKIEDPTTSVEKSGDSFSQSEFHDNGEDEAIYGNYDIIRKSTESSTSGNLRRTGSNVSQRGTVYINEDIVKQNSVYENHVLPHVEGKLKKVAISKRPLPLPRDYEYKVISDLPKSWQRLNEIFNQDLITETDRSEVAEIQKQAELAKSLFERKIKQIFQRLEDTVEL